MAQIPRVAAQHRMGCVNQQAPIAEDATQAARLKNQSCRAPRETAGRHRVPVSQQAKHCDGCNSVPARTIQPHPDRSYAVKQRSKVVGDGQKLSGDSHPQLAGRLTGAVRTHRLGVSLGELGVALARVHSFTAEPSSKYRQQLVIGQGQSSAQFRGSLQHQVPRAGRDSGKRTGPLQITRNRRDDSSVHEVHLILPFSAHRPLQYSWSRGSIAFSWGWARPTSTLPARSRLRKSGDASKGTSSPNCCVHVSRSSASRAAATVATILENRSVASQQNDSDSLQTLLRFSRRAVRWAPKLASRCAFDWASAILPGTD